MTRLGGPWSRYQLVEMKSRMPYRAWWMLRLVECDWQIGRVYMTRRQGEYAGMREEQCEQTITVGAVETEGVGSLCQHGREARQEVLHPEAAIAISAPMALALASPRIAPTCACHTPESLLAAPNSASRCIHRHP